MRKNACLLLLACVGALVFYSCTDSQLEEKLKAKLAVLDTCLVECAVKEKACLDEKEKCNAEAWKEFIRIGDSCFRKDDPERTKACMGNARQDYENKIARCNQELRACMGELNNCRDECRKRVTKEPDTE